MLDAQSCEVPSHSRCDAYGGAGGCSSIAGLQVALVKSRSVVHLTYELINRENRVFSASSERRPSVGTDQRWQCRRQLGAGFTFSALAGPTVLPLKGTDDAERVCLPCECVWLYVSKDLTATH